MGVVLSTVVVGRGPSPLVPDNECRCLDDTGRTGRLAMRGRWVMVAVWLGGLGGCLGVIGDRADQSEPNVGTEPAASCEALGDRVVRLTPPQMVRSAALVFPHTSVGAGDLDTTLVVATHAFDNDADVQHLATPHVRTILGWAEHIAEAAAEDAGALDPCLPAGIDDDACIEPVLEALMTRAYRRPAEADDVDELRALVDALASESPSVRLAAAFTAVLMSPEFLYRAERSSAGQLDAHASAALIAYVVTDAPPDDALQRAAASGELATYEGRLAQARRLLSTPEGGRGLRAFVAQLFGYERVDTIVKDPAYFPTFDSTMAESMRAEAEAFVTHVLWQDEPTLERLLSAPLAFPDAATAPLYGLDPSGFAAGDHRLISELDHPRVGLLSLPAMMASHARADEADIVKRGTWVRTELLCQSLAPPADLNAVPPAPDGVLTQRQRLEAHMSDPSCAACHSLTDPIGYGFHVYDGIGRYRETEVGRPIDDAGTIVGLDEEDASYDGLGEMAQLLSQSEQVADCLVSRVAVYAQATASACAGDAASVAFQSSGGDLIEAFAHAVASDQLHERMTP